MERREGDTPRDLFADPLLQDPGVPPLGLVDLASPLTGPVILPLGRNLKSPQ